MTPLLKRLCALLVGTFMPALAAAQSSDQPLTLSVSAYGFVTKLANHQVVLPLTYVLDVPYSHSLDKVKMAHTVYLDLAKGHWGGYVDKQYIKATDHDHVHQIPFQLKAKMDKTSFGIYMNAIDNKDKQGPHLTLQPTLGLHLNRVSIDIKADLMGQAFYLSRDAAWSEPYIGARFFYHHNPRWALAGQANVGSRHSKDYQAYALYRSKFFNQPMSVRLGYRMVKQKHSKGDFIWAIKESGPVLGFSMQIL